MSHGYLVVSPEQVELMSVTELANAVRARWPQSAVNTSINGYFEIARWFRSVLTDEHRLVLSETSSGRILDPFTDNTTLADIIAALDGSPAVAGDFADTRPGDGTAENS